MLQITADVFSGRPNPTWTVTDEREARAILNELAQNPTLLTNTPPAEAGLGFRGVIVEPISDHLGEDYGLASSLYVPLNAGGFGTKGAEIAERLINLIPQASPSLQAAENAPALDEALQSFLTTQILVSRGASVADGAAVAATAEATEAVAPHVMCYYDTSPYNPGYWNNDATIRTRNNCYNYASNKRTDTFAQPGRGCGHMYTAITCAEVTRAALCDGLHRRYDCFPDSEYPRYLVALVIAPGPGFVDFHWYRKMREGFWAHKPGSTAVRNVDNNNQVIMDPATCARGPYTQFCGYFYTCRSQKIK